ncbi:MAG TPA: peptide deformylase [Candidatus Polarisedimenticolaceae bacterium]|nr:peptide deformylase [Candidatus Polarisedimenticolaceae bacterium]
MTLTIVRLGHPALRAKSLPVSKKELATPVFQRFLDELAEVCITHNGMGIAAPQVGVNKRVIVVHVHAKNPRYPGKKSFPLTIVINPRVAFRSPVLSDDWEGDLSIAIRGVVPRAKTCEVRGLDRRGNPVIHELNYGFHARVFQHEIDHLNGVLFLDRVKRRQTLSEPAEWERYWKDRQI